MNSKLLIISELIIHDGFYPASKVALKYPIGFLMISLL